MDHFLAIKINDSLFLILFQYRRRREFQRKEFRMASQVRPPHFRRLLT